MSLHIFISFKTKALFLRGLFVLYSPKSYLVFLSQCHGSYYYIKEQHKVQHQKEHFLIKLIISVMKKTWVLIILD